eukprot:8173741-Alexandrium_andersonii.AAC.1
MDSVSGPDSPALQNRFAPSPPGTGSIRTARAVSRSEGPARARSAQAELKGAKTDKSRQGARRAAASEARGRRDAGHRQWSEQRNDGASASASGTGASSRYH